MDDAGKSKGTCQQEGAPQWKIAAVSGAGAGNALDEDDLDGMGSSDILKGVGLYRADALADGPWRSMQFLFEPVQIGPPGRRNHL